MSHIHIDSASASHSTDEDRKFFFFCSISKNTEKLFKGRKVFNIEGTVKSSWLSQSSKFHDNCGASNDPQEPERGI